MSDIAWFIFNFIAELFAPRLGNRAGVILDIVVCLIVTSSLLAYRRLHNAFSAGWLLPLIRTGRRQGRYEEIFPKSGCSDRAR